MFVSNVDKKDCFVCDSEFTGEDAAACLYATKHHDKSRHRYKIIMRGNSFVGTPRRVAQASSCSRTEHGQFLGLHEDG